MTYTIVALYLVISLNRDLHYYRHHYLISTQKPRDSNVLDHPKIISDHAEVINYLITLIDAFIKVVWEGFKYLWASW